MGEKRTELHTFVSLKMDETLFIEKYVTAYTDLRQVEKKTTSVCVRASCNVIWKKENRK